MLTNTYKREKAKKLCLIGQNVLWEKDQTVKTAWIAPLRLHVQNTIILMIYFKKWNMIIDNRVEDPICDL